MSASLVVSIPANAQCLLCARDPGTPDISGASTIPLAIEIDAGLDFDRVAMTAPAGGSVLIDPIARSRVVSGALSDLGGLSMAGSVTVRGEPGRSLRVSLPDSVDLRSSGGGRAVIRRLSTDLPPNPRLGRDGILRFAFGGRLDVTGDLDGNYRGNVAITVEYQ